MTTLKKMNILHQNPVGITGLIRWDKPTDKIPFYLVLVIFSSSGDCLIKKTQKDFTFVLCNSNSAAFVVPCDTKILSSSAIGIYALNQTEYNKIQEMLDEYGKERDTLWYLENPGKFPRNIGLQWWGKKL